MIETFNISGVHYLIARQMLKVDLQDAWEFLSDPSNLAAITPPDMGFSITSPHEEEMYPGQIITYKISPIKGINMNWVTEITHVAEGKLFVDEQRFGPYKFWHHRHILSKSGDSTGMTDIVVYKLPFGPVGRLINKLFIRNSLLKIFNYRRSKLEEKFNQKS